MNWIKCTRYEQAAYLCEHRKCDEHFLNRKRGGITFPKKTDRPRPREPEPSIIDEKTIGTSRAWLSRREFWVSVSV
jgi:hypothetical protein